MVDPLLESTQPLPDRAVYLYEIKHKSLPIIYIGITNDPKRRWREHKLGSSNSLLAGAISELGADSFLFRVVTGGARTDIEELEELAITEEKHDRQL